MKRSIISLIFTFLVSFSVFSQSSVWMIEGNGTKMYLGGSIHILREQDYPLPAEFESAFEKSDILVLEADIDPQNQKAVAQEIIGLTLYPNNKSLKTELREEVYNKLDSAFTTAGLSLKQMTGFKPVMAILTLMQIELVKMGVTSEGVDMYFLKKANDKGMNLLFLEKVEEQIKLITQMGEGTENDYVLQSLEEMSFYREEFEKSIESWRNGEVSQWLAQIEEYKNEYPELYFSLLVERNNRWMQKLEKYMQTPEVEFVVVGAMHLPGTDGVLKQLKDMGFKIKQL
ncbi:MAG: TraB/GumN family protein [Prolixibacteraceae bacterium]|nr:TraB/GumN family protein [Prolixibacteraceae bacterium]